MSPVISLLLPTRGRPTLVERLFGSMVETTSRLDRVEVGLYAYEDDSLFLADAGYYSRSDL